MNAKRSIHLCRALLFALLTVSPVALYPEEHPGPNYSLSQLHALALENSLALKATELQIDEVIHAGAREGRWLNPDLGISGGGRFGGKDTGYEYGISIEQEFYFPGKNRVRRDIARLRQEQARLNHEELKHYITFDTTNIAFQYAVAMQKLRHADGRLKRIRLIQAYLSGRKAISPKHRVEKDIITAKISILAGQVSETRNHVYILYNRLNLYTGLGYGKLPTIDVPWYVNPPVFDFPALRASLEQSNPGILKRSSAARRAKEEVRLARKERAPDFDIGVYYNEESLGSSRERSVGAGITIPLPLSGRTGSAIREKESAARVEMTLLEQSRLEALSRLETLHARYTTATDMIRAFPLARLDSIERSMRYADYEFRRGLIDLATYLEMDSSMHEYIESVYQAQIDMASVHAELVFLSGGRAE
ncbi:MAG: TolC family protein [Spirochaetes bacterium]|nr:TolC family protein [Spirochaetota bacterium]